MPDINITNHGISKLLSNLDSSKAAGPDELKPKILKELAHQGLIVILKYHDL
jgi:hypothetical protein